MYVTCCPVCGNTVIYANYEESITAEFCPHCLRKKEFESDIRYDNVKYDLKFIECLQKKREVERKFYYTPPPAPPL